MIMGFIQRTVIRESSRWSFIIVFIMLMSSCIKVHTKLRYEQKALRSNKANFVS